MRTKIQCGWLVGYAGSGHVLWRDAELVYEGTQIVFVGERFDGTADQVIDAGGKLVIPGFIDTHVHSGHRASHRLISDVGRPDYFGQPFFEISVPRAGTRVPTMWRQRKSYCSTRASRLWSCFATASRLLWSLAAN